MGLIVKLDLSLAQLSPSLFQCFLGIQASCNTSLEFKVPTKGLLEQTVIYRLV